MEIDRQLDDRQKVNSLKISAGVVAATQENHRKLIKILYPVDSYVRWYVRPYFKAGIVESHSPTTDMLRVKGTDGRMYNVFTSAIIAAVEHADA